MILNDADVVDPARPADGRRSRTIIPRPTDTEKGHARGDSRGHGGGGELTPAPPKPLVLGGRERG
jgi:hypothetical protein